MPTTFDEKDIRALATAEVFERGKAYWKRGAVSDLRLRGDTLSGNVGGSESYHVEIDLEDGRPDHMSCSCPYEWGGACKHIVAVLLAYRAEGDRLPKSKPIAELLAPLGKDDLLKLLMRRIKSDLRLTSWLEAELAAPAPRKDGKRAKVDAAPIKRQAHALFGARYRNGSYWDGYSASGDIAELQQLTEKAVPYLEAGDGRGALEILEAVTDAFVEDWIKYSSGQDEHFYELFNDLGRMIAEAAMMTDFKREEAEGYAELVEGWVEDLSDYGDFAGFDTAILALRADLAAPGFRAVLTGASKEWPPDGNEAWLDGEFIGLVLRMLERHERLDEYLNFAFAAGDKEAYGGMLIKRGRLAEAAAFALTVIEEPGQALTLAKTLDAAGSAVDAVAVAKRGLTLKPPEYEDWQRVKLAQWLRDKAVEAGDHALAASTAELCFAQTFSLADFAAAERASGPLWSEVRGRLLAALAQRPRNSERPAIYLREGMIAEAVATALADRSASPHDDVLMALAEAARRTHPEWVIALAREVADPIMDQGNSGSYALAARWLAQAARAYEDDGRDEEWRETLEGLIERHKRKHKLKAELVGLR